MRQLEQGQERVGPICRPGRHEGRQREQQGPAGKAPRAAASPQRQDGQPGQRAEVSPAAARTQGQLASGDHEGVIGDAMADRIRGPVRHVQQSMRCEEEQHRRGQDGDQDAGQSVAVGRRSW